MRYEDFPRHEHVWPAGGTVRRLHSLGIGRRPRVDHLQPELRGSSSTLAVAATNATTVAVTGSDGSIYSLSATGGTQTVSPATTTTYTAKATGAGGNVTATAVITDATSFADREDYCESY